MNPNTAPGEDAVAISGGDDMALRRPSDPEGPLVRETGGPYIVRYEVIDGFITPLRSGMPEWMDRHFPEVQGISVGRCERSYEPLGVTGGHTHSDDDSICIQPDHWNPEGPTATVIHEAEHVRTAADHGRAWRSAYRKALTDWGYPKGMKIAAKTGHLLTLDDPSDVAPGFEQRDRLVRAAEEPDRQDDDSGVADPRHGDIESAVQDYKERQRSAKPQDPGLPRDLEYRGMPNEPRYHARRGRGGDMRRR